MGLWGHLGVLEQSKSPNCHQRLPSARVCTSCQTAQPMHTCSLSHQDSPPHPLPKVWMISLDQERSNTFDLPRRAPRLDLFPSQPPPPELQPLFSRVDVSHGGRGAAPPPPDLAPQPRARGLSEGSKFWRWVGGTYNNSKANDTNRIKKGRRV